MPYSRLLFSFDGRISRSDYWLKFNIPCMVILFISVFLDEAIGTTRNGGMALFTLIFLLLSIYPFLAVNVKRCHDRDRTGWFVLVFLIPIVSL